MPRRVAVIDSERENSLHALAQDALGSLFEIQKEIEPIPDLILLCAISSSSNPVQTLKEIRESQQLSQIPLIVVTGILDDNVRADCLNHGADDLVHYPIGPKELQARIHLRFGKKAEEDRMSELVKCGNLTIDLGSMDVFVAKRRIHLTALEFGILRLLLQNQGRILNRDTILERIWNGRDVSDRVVDNHIVQLRKKLTGFNYRITSIYGAGYGIRR